MGMSHVNFGNFAARSKSMKSKNDDLKKILSDIKTEINRSENSKIYISDSGVKIREKIADMQSRFDSYYKVVDSYAGFIEATADAYRSTEQVNVSKANKFI